MSGKFKFSELFNGTSIKGLFLSSALAFSGLMGMSTDAEAKNFISGRGGPTSQQVVSVSESRGDFDNDIIRSGARGKAASYAPLLQTREFRSRYEGIRNGIEGAMGIAGGISIGSGVRGVPNAQWNGSSKAYMALSNMLYRVAQLEDIERIGLNRDRRRDAWMVADENERRIYEQQQDRENRSLNVTPLNNGYQLLIRQGEAVGGKLQHHPLNSNALIYVRRSTNEPAYLTFDGSGNVVKITDPASMERFDSASVGMIKGYLNNEFADPRNAPRRGR